MNISTQRPNETDSGYRQRVLDHYQKKYGPDFLAKLPKYKTAKMEGLGEGTLTGGEWVGIVNVDIDQLLVEIRTIEGSETWVDLSALDCFCL